MKQGLLSPFASPVFRSLWLASVASNFGTMMQSVGVTWLMTSLTSSPPLIAMVPFAALSPVLLFGLLGGVLADTIDRRTWLICSQLWMTAAALAMGLIASAHAATPFSLLALTFALGTGNALNIPAWQSLIQDIVPIEHVPAAVSLNSMSFNTARMVGPVCGGILVGLAGPPVVFFFNAASFLGTVLVLIFWRPEKTQRQKHKILSAFGSGIHYVLKAHHLRGPLARVGMLCFFSSSAIALLPIIARDRMELDATGFGLLMGSLGFGALVGGAAVPAFRRILSPSAIVGWGTALSAAALAGLAVAPSLGIGILALLFYGFAWISSMVNLNVSVQTSVPQKLRGRAMAFYFTLFQGSFALGALATGFAAKAFGVTATLLAASAALFLWLPPSLKLLLPNPEGSRTPEDPTEG